MAEQEERDYRRLANEEETDEVEAHRRSQDATTEPKDDDSSDDFEAHRRSQA